MLDRQPIIALIWLIGWGLLTCFYSIEYHIPREMNLWMGAASALFIAMAIGFLSRDEYALKVLIVALSLVVLLSSMQVSYDQRPFDSLFLKFYLLHFAIMIFVVAIASLLPAFRSELEVQSDHNDYILVIVFIVFLMIELAVISVKGARVFSLIAGEKIPGDEFKVVGLSGIYGILYIFLMCSFSSMGIKLKIAFVFSVIIVSLLDAKRGEIIRLVTFLVFYFSFIDYRVKPRSSFVLTAGGVMLAAMIFVFGGEARQGLYSPGFSISDVLNSRVNNTWIDWTYGYIGINGSVLHETVISNNEPLGFFATMLNLSFNSTALNPEEFISINGFNAGTVFAIFAGNQSTSPSIDYVAFCLLVGLLVFLARLVNVGSINAFIAMVIFGFIFGNYLMLPYYLVGFFMAIGYQFATRQTALGRSNLAVSA